METIYNEVVQKLLPIYYRKALKKEGIDPITQPEVDVVQVEEGKPLKFNAKVEIKPDAELGNYKGIEVSKEKVEIDEQWIDQQLAILQNRFAQLDPVARPVKEGDSVLINYDGKVDGKAFEGGSAEDYLLEIGSNTFVGDFEKQLEGAKRGEIREVFAEFPEGYGNPDLAGKKAYFKVLVKEVKQKILPETNDDFAKDVSEFDTLDELRNDIREKLSGNKEQQVDFKLRMDVLDKVVEDAEIDLPETMIEDRKEFKIKDVAASLQKQGMSLEDYLKSSSQDKEEFEEHAQKEAVEELKREAVLEAVANAENLEITDEETDNEIKRLAESMNKDPEASAKAARDQGTYEFFRGNLLSRKAWNWLVDNAKVTEIERKEEAEQAGEKEEVPEEAQGRQDESSEAKESGKNQLEKTEKDAEDEESKK